MWAKRVIRHLNRSLGLGVQINIIWGLYSPSPRWIFPILSTVRVGKCTNECFSGSKAKCFPLRYKIPEKLPLRDLIPEKYPTWAWAKPVILHLNGSLGLDMQINQILDLYFPSLRRIFPILSTVEVGKCTSGYFPRSKSEMYSPEIHNSGKNNPTRPNSWKIPNLSDPSVSGTGDSVSKPHVGFKDKPPVCPNSRDLVLNCVDLLTGNNPPLVPSLVSFHFCRISLRSPAGKSWWKSTKTRTGSWRWRNFATGSNLPRSAGFSRTWSGSGRGTTSTRTGSSPGRSTKTPPTATSWVRLQFGTAFGELGDWDLLFGFCGGVAGKRDSAEAGFGAGGAQSPA